MPSKVWDEISYPFPNFNGSTVEAWEWISNFIPHYIMDVIAYPWWYLKHVDKRGSACYIDDNVSEFFHEYSHFNNGYIRLIGTWSVKDAPRS